MAASDARSYLMAAEAAAEIVSQKLEILLSDPVCVGCLSMETHVKNTKATLAMIQELLSTQFRQSETTESWRRLLQTMNYAEEFIDKFHLREAGEWHNALHVAVRPLAELVSKCMLWRDLSYLAKDVDKMGENMFLTVWDVAKGERKKEPASSSSGASVLWQSKKLGRLTIFRDRQEWRKYPYRKAEKEQIMERIGGSVDLGVRATSILGEQGVGKTFLASWVYREAKYQSFEWRAWVRVSTCMDQREFLLEILKQVENLPTDVKDMNFYEIINMLCKKLTNTKSFLIVLDDVHPSDEQFLRGLVMIIPPCSQGHIITTTQDTGIARTMNSFDTGPIKLINLIEEESQRMLAMKLHGPHVQSLTQEEENILKRCPGLPLCISLLGGLMSNAREHERTAFLKDGSPMTLLDILQLSYHSLPVHLKPCFIYMALFPVTSAIPTRRLVRLWLAEGLLDSNCYDEERERKKLLEEVGETFILELADRNLIDVVSQRADGSPKACQMLTSMYDMIRPIAMSTGFIHIHAVIRNPTGQQQQLPTQLLERTKVRWLAEHTDSRGDSFPDLYISHVHSFMSFYVRRGILSRTFLRNMTSKTAYSLLRVLDLEGVYKPSLQGVLHKLVLLRYLGLRSTVLNSLPSTIADLHHLETLDIKHTNITSLPSSLWKARNLRHLHLNWFYIDLKNILKAWSNNVNALTKLQTLSGLVIGEGRENLMMGHMDSLTTLTTLKLYLQRSDRDTSGAAGNAVADWISFKLTNLQSLTFGVIKKKAKPAEQAYHTKEDKSKKEAEPATSRIGQLPKLLLGEQHHDLLELYLLGQLNKPIWTKLLPGSLRVLTLSGSMVETDMMAELGGLLKDLRTFRLLANSFLGTSVRFIKDGFPSLMILKIWKLPKLEEVIIEQGAMQHLRELEFRHLDGMKNIEGIKQYEELEITCVVVKKGAQNFVDRLKREKQKKTNLYEIEEIETDDNEL